MPTAAAAPAVSIAARPDDENTASYVTAATLSTRLERVTHHNNQIAPMDPTASAAAVYCRSRLCEEYWGHVSSFVSK